MQLQATLTTLTASGVVPLGLQQDTAPEREVWSVWERLPTCELLLNCTCAWDCSMWVSRLQYDWVICKGDS
eukprot:6428528-Amphidinium_carterae.1